MGVGPIITAALGLASHVDDASDAHDASAISVAPILGLGNPPDVQAALAAVPSRYVASTDTRTIDQVTFTEFQAIASPSADTVYQVSGDPTVGQVLRPGFYIGRTGSATLGLVNSTVYGFVLKVAGGGQIQRIRVRCVTGSPSAIGRVGIYRMTGFYTGTLVHDGGSNLDLSTAGVKEHVTSPVMVPGVYLACLFNFGGTPTLFAIEQQDPALPVGLSADAVVSGMTNTHAWTGGALPSTVSLTTVANRTPSIGIQAL